MKKAIEEGRCGAEWMYLLVVIKFQIARDRGNEYLEALVGVSFVGVENDAQAVIRALKFAQAGNAAAENVFIPDLQVIALAIVRALHVKVQKLQMKLLLASVPGVASEAINAIEPVGIIGRVIGAGDGVLEAPVSTTAGIIGAEGQRDEAANEK
jgi:hypothetical protein